jgi:hypothetical protein
LKARAHSAVPLLPAVALAGSNAETSQAREATLEPRWHPRFLLVVSFISAASWASSCATSMGPGYSIESQEIHVQFQPAPEPRIHVACVYQLRNTGNQSLAALELRLPAHHSFRVEAAQVAWDDATLSPQVAPDNPRDTVLALPKQWHTSDRHALHLSVDFLSSDSRDAGFAFASDAFFLPSEGWAPELLPARGLFGTGGVPPKEWRLSVRVPNGFLVHTSGHSRKTSRSGGEANVESVQAAADRYPFVVAGRYSEAESRAGQEKVVFWTRTKVDPASLSQSVDSIARTVASYNATFGNRAQKGEALWVVECPVALGCFPAE